MNSLMQKINLVKITGYILVVCIVFSSLYFILNSINNNITVSIKMKQTQKQDVTVYYALSEYDVRDNNVTQIVEPSDELQEIIFKIPKYVYSLDLRFNSEKEEYNNIEIESIYISSLFNKKHLKEYDNYKINVDNEFYRLTIDDNFIFSKFQVISKIKIFCLLFASIIVFISKRKINTFF